ncbi:hypothetical protein A2W13_00155 [Candidatus Woesebacteria bacterium RBG_16_36_11]|uniref:AB hydrolase-1 domain-containing protein n=2 Tax=Candidatus Woeseibacteriota TaxID=1752722 RepID=A0A1F7X7W8_9BACT|nr:MAG: hypothetical protein A2W13_00155 [Candidatus Woesebacteria bacterium RBG_16_36_11]OGM17039.1 MAG: hypothetical protein A2V55_02240 [Candidatus Woesebacteria bacterium RBG_19FT_COMBO_37_29]
MKNNKKIVVLLHGYPEPIHKGHPLYKYFKNNNYEIVSIYLFDPKFKLTQEDVKKFVSIELKGEDPGVIVGVSLGGLIAPYLAKYYPSAKLVLIATGPYIRTKFTNINKYFSKLENSKILIPLHWLLLHTPSSLYSYFYKRLNKSITKTKERKILETHIKGNWKHLKNIPLSEHREVVDFLISTDNTLLLRSLNNKTIIFTGIGDNMMPSELSIIMKNLIKRSEIVSCDQCIHFDVFNKENYKHLDNFLSK